MIMHAFDPPVVLQAWFNLGLVHEARGLPDVASECFLVAIDYEGTAPTLPFSVLPRAVSKRV
jgi:hypothetical protein